MHIKKIVPTGIWTQTFCVQGEHANHWARQPYDDNMENNGILLGSRMSLLLIQNFSRGMKQIYQQEYEIVIIQCVYEMQATQLNRFTHISKQDLK